MIKFCRNCGKELIASPSGACTHCKANAVKASSFCRYCGHSTTADDAICPTCGAAIKPLPASLKALDKEHPTLVKLGKIINLSIVAILIALYITFALPKAVTKSIKATTDELVQSSTGYTTFPLESIAVFPTTIPRLNDAPGNAIVFRVNSTEQLTIYAVYKNALAENGTSNNTTGHARFEEVTDKAVFQSGNDRIATVTASGLVRGESVGSTNITIYYTAAPGSANKTAAAEGKIPVTVQTTVPVTVR